MKENVRHEFTPREITEILNEIEFLKERVIKLQEQLEKLQEQVEAITTILRSLKKELDKLDIVL